MISEEAEERVRKADQKALSQIRRVKEKEMKPIIMEAREMGARDAIDRKRYIAYSRRPTKVTNPTILHQSPEVIFTIRRFAT